MRAHVLRNTLISILVALFSITATSCGRQALSPIPPQRKKIVIHESWKHKIVDTVFSYPGICVISFIILECVDMKIDRDKARKLAAAQAQVAAIPPRRREPQVNKLMKKLRQPDNRNGRAG